MATEKMATNFDVQQAPEDPLFGLMAAYKKDTFDKKVDLGIGAYRDNNAKPWILPVVKKVCTCSRMDDGMLTCYLGGCCNPRRPQSQPRIPPDCRPR